MFMELKESLNFEDVDRRRSMKDNFDSRMEEIVKRYDPYSHLHKHVEYMRNGIGLRFTGNT